MGAQTPLKDTVAKAPDGNLVIQIERISSLIASYASRPGTVNESNTIRALVTPMIEALGWPIHDLDEVQSEYRHKSSDNPVDFALLIDGTPNLFVEVKSLDKDLDDRKWIVQTLNYANTCNVEWAALTNGREWRVYNVHHKAEAEEKLFFSVDITGNAIAAARRMSMLGRDRMSPTRALDQLWRETSIDHEMRRIIDELPENRSAVRAMAKASNGSLSEGEVKSALRRLRLRADWRSDSDLFPALGFVPEEQGDESSHTEDNLADEAQSQTATAPKPSRRRGKTKRSDIRVPDMIELGLLSEGQTLRIRNHPQSDARIVDGAQVEYMGSKVSLQKWGCLVTGWTAIQIYKHAETEDGELLQAIRERAPVVKS